MGETGRVVGIDHIPELVEQSVANLKSDPKLAAFLQGSSASARSSASTAAAATQTQNRSPSWSASGPQPHSRGSAEVGAGFDSARVRLVCGDGRRGFPEEAPYDAIHVGAAAPSIPEEVRCAALSSSCALRRSESLLHSLLLPQCFSILYIDNHL